MYGALFLAAWLVTLTAPATAKMKFRYGAARYELKAKDCWLGATQTMVGGYAGAQVNVKKRQPRVGQVFYVRLVAHNAGLKCGGEWTYADIGLPPGVRPAISRRHPIRLWIKGDGGKWTRSKPVTRRLARKHTGKGCFGMNAGRRSPHPIPYKAMYRFDLPVKAKRPVNRKNGCACVVGAFTTSSGTSQPERNWSFNSFTFPLHGPYGPLRVFPR